MTTFRTFDNTVPAGNHSAILESVDEITGQWGDRLQWKFKVAEGEFSDAIASAFSGAERASLRSNLARFLGMLEGEMPRAGVSRDPDAYVGRSYVINVEANDDGATKVTSFKPCDTVVAAAPAAEPTGETSTATGAVIPF